MKPLSQIFIVCLLAISSLLILTAHGHTLLIESSGNKVAYALNNVETSLGKLMDAASEMLGKEPQSPIVIIFDSNIPLEVALDAQGIFNKVGFPKVTLFARWKKTGKMCEVSLGMPVPFTINPQ